MFFDIKYSTLEIDQRDPNDKTYHIRHYTKNDECVAEAFITEDQAVHARENNPGLRVTYIKD